MTPIRKKAIVVMGVSGCGKSTIGKALAAALDYPFYDADDFHPQENIDKMKCGEPLNDRDRRPWLEHLEELINTEQTNGVVLACSALKQSYRDILSRRNQALVFVHLVGSSEWITSRMRSRDHFMPIGLLKSQFEQLEPPDAAITISIDQSIPEMIQKILKELQD
jgi:gluconokinase